MANKDDIVLTDDYLTHYLEQAKLVIEQAKKDDSKLPSMCSWRVEDIVMLLTEHLQMRDALTTRSRKCDALDTIAKQNGIVSIARADDKVLIASLCSSGGRLRTALGANIVEAATILGADV